MKYLKIQNKGHLIPEALTLIGASSKRESDGLIGRFGSGNKYALAYLLRNNYNLSVIVGSEELKITTTPKDFKDKSYNVVVIDGKETSITTEMGIDWELWQAIREIYSNALDEGMTFFGIVDRIDYEDEHTSFFIEMDNDLYNLYYNIGDYFAIEKTVLFEGSKGKIYKKSSTDANIFRRGIKCLITSESSIFDYDINDIALDESRLIKNSWELPNSMWDILYECDNEFVIRSILNNINDKKYIENNIRNYFFTVSPSNMNKAWLDALQNSKIAPEGMGGYLKEDELLKTKLLPANLYNSLISKFGDELKVKSFRVSGAGVNYLDFDITPIISSILKDVYNFFNECGFPIPYEVKVVNITDGNVHGTVEGETILICQKAFSRGKQWIANIIIEEFIHIKHDAADETRKFQDSVIDEFITYMKTSNSYNL